MGEELQGRHAPLEKGGRLAWAWGFGHVLAGLTHRLI